MLVVLLLSLETQPLALSSLLTLPTPLLRLPKYRPTPSLFLFAPSPDHTNAEKVIYDFQRLGGQSVACQCKAVFFEYSLPHRHFCEEVILTHQTESLYFISSVLLLVQSDFKRRSQMSLSVFEWSHFPSDQQSTAVVLNAVKVPKLHCMYRKLKIPIKSLCPDHPSTRMLYRTLIVVPGSFIYRTVSTVKGYLFWWKTGDELLIYISFFSLFHYIGPYSKKCNRTIHSCSTP